MLNEHSQKIFKKQLCTRTLRNSLFNFHEAFPRIICKIKKKFLKTLLANYLFGTYVVLKKGKSLSLLDKVIPNKKTDSTSEFYVIIFHG